ncbi:NADH dehydrogenase [Rhodoblastus acidophilus]|uniref:NAD(P)/FAD-dependent oxidoreductase n=1 Tax=Rhodoblastus acidophilus TaxID=1074 RepID=UPI002224F35B|nr:NAD(P)/FAD-dependent oxidoreductase [Rhodoblastus acidophilus]MCW2286197.1 NADH dehydrogenase [Rhodoblastus acidophilus]MCW2335121.1 NADH dehydrogenase [Rhodoblastus acidophilus]
MSQRPRVVILGAGFGGVNAAKVLGGCAADVVLVDKTNHHLFQPLLYQVATAALAPSDIATATRVVLRHCKNVTVLMGEAVGIDPDAREVRLEDGARLRYDYLVVAIGSAYSFFGHDDWARHVHVLKTLDDALKIRSALLAAFELAERCEDKAEIAPLMTFVVVGGGPTGVELAGTIAELSRTTLARDFRTIEPRSAHIVLCEAGPRILPSFPPAQSDYALRALQNLGVDVRVGAKVGAIDAGSIQIGAERLQSSVVVWCAGTAAHPASKWLGATAASNGAVRVGPDCALPGRPEIFVIGDVASFDGADGRPLPGLAPVAKQQGLFVGRLLRARIDGRPGPKRFRYRDYGMMAIIGRSRAVAQLFGLRMSGFVAWLAWSLIHLMLLVDFRSRLTVYVNWSWAWFTYGRGARLLTHAPRWIARARGKARRDAA